VTQFTYSIGHGVMVTFPSKPPESIRAMLKANGFRWAHGSWYRQRVTGAADFLTALERKCNPERPDAACWKCGDPNGFFRHRGAAAPVWCDACNKAVLDAETTLKQASFAPVDRSDLDYEDACRDACGL
jgi:hypothetical protein